MSLSIYGKLPSGERLRKINQSPNYKNGSFQNLSHTPAMAQDVSFLKILKDFVKKNKDVKPPQALPFVKTDLKNLPATGSTLIWFGHSSYLLRVEGVTILVDPVLSGNAAPMSFMVKAFPGSDSYNAEDFPVIDILLLTHDHYDHLDYKTFLALKDKVRKVVCSLGVGSHLAHWGMEEALIEELDWWENFSGSSVSLTAAPGRHFSGRGVKRGQSLWSSFILQTTQQRLFLGGDSGYDSHFKEIGARYGSFDLAILEAGQYNRSWPYIHMMPEETVQAALDLNAAKLLPVHWGKFTLAMHPWNEPIRRVTQRAQEVNLNVLTPLIGQALDLYKPAPAEAWWEL